MLDTAAIAKHMLHLLLSRSDRTVLVPYRSIRSVTFQPVPATEPGLISWVDVTIDTDTQAWTVHLEEARASSVLDQLGRKITEATR